MKKIIALFVIMLACSFSANAQQKNANTAVATPQQAAAQVNSNAEKAAMKDMQALTEFVQLTDAQANQLKGLFLTKHKTLMGQQLSDERKSVLAQSVEAKLKAALTQDQIAKLEDNAKLMNMLTH